MERNEIIILGALVAAFFILRPRAAPAAGTGAGGAAAAPAGSTGTGGGAGSGYQPQPIAEQPGISASAIWPEAFTGGGQSAPASSGAGTSPVQDPVVAAGPGAVWTPMPKQPVYFDFA